MYIDDRERLHHMLDAARKAEEFSHNKTRTDLDTDEMFLFALVRAIEIIGESAVHITDEFKANHNEIEWIDIIGMRNRLIHGYFDINHDIVWDTVKKYVPDLINKLEKILKHTSQKNRGPNSRKP